MELNELIFLPSSLRLCEKAKTIDITRLAGILLDRSTAESRLNPRNEDFLNRGAPCHFLTTLIGGYVATFSRPPYSIKIVLVLLSFLVLTKTADAQNVVLRFDELANSTTVADQYLNQYGVRFSSGNPSFPVHTHQNCGPTCFPTSAPNFISTLPDTSGVLTVEFQYPVSGLTFYMIGVDAFFNQFALIDVYRSGAFYATYPVFGNGNFTVGFTFGSLDNISKIVIKGITDPSGIGFDDFSFTVPWEIKITSSRVAGFLNQTTQNALLAGDISLLANPLPAAFLRRDLLLDIQRSFFCVECDQFLIS